MKKNVIFQFAMLNYQRVIWLISIVNYMVIVVNMANNKYIYICWLVVDLPLWKMMDFVSWGTIPNIWKNRVYVPNQISNEQVGNLDILRNFQRCLWEKTCVFFMCFVHHHWDSESRYLSHLAKELAPASANNHGIFQKKIENFALDVPLKKTHWISGTRNWTQPLDLLVYCNLSYINRAHFFHGVWWFTSTLLGISDVRVSNYQHGMELGSCSKSAWRGASPMRSRSCLCHSHLLFITRLTEVTYWC